METNNAHCSHWAATSQPNHLSPATRAGGPVGKTREQGSIARGGGGGRILAAGGSGWGGGWGIGRGGGR
jgi:hypothetical protein